MSGASGLEHLKLFLPGLESALEDSEVSEIMINGPGNVWVERAGRLTAHAAPDLDESALQRAYPAGLRRRAGLGQRQFSGRQPDRILVERAQAWRTGAVGQQDRTGREVFPRDHRYPVPLNMNILKALKRSSLGIDLYLWMTYRTFTLKRPLRLSWARLYGQFGSDPSKASVPRPVDDFRKGLPPKVEEA